MHSLPPENEHSTLSGLNLNRIVYICSSIGPKLINETVDTRYSLTSEAQLSKPLARVRNDNDFHIENTMGKYVSIYVFNITRKLEVDNVMHQVVWLILPRRHIFLLVIC